MKYFIGIDSSTTATKALLVDEKGQVLGVTSNEYAFETPQPLWSEQSPHLWWDATAESIRQVLAQTDVDAKMVSGMPWDLKRSNIRQAPARLPYS